MSFVITRPEALTAAASTLQQMSSALAAQNAAAAMPTTGVVPAAADEVSALQATQFAAYGTLYQQISSQAQAIDEMFVNTLRGNSGAYGSTEASNAVANAAASGSAQGASTLLGAGGMAGVAQVSNFGSAASDLLQLGSSGFLAPGALADGEAAGLGWPMLISSTAPAGVGGAGPMSVTAITGQASSIRGMSVPPSWAGAAAAATDAAPATLAGASWTTAAGHGARMTAVPAGLASAAAAGRGGIGFGTPRYGDKPTVMPKPAVV